MLQVVDHKPNGLTPSIANPKEISHHSFLNPGHFTSMCYHVGESTSVGIIPYFDFDVLCDAINFEILGHLYMWIIHGMMGNCLRTFARIVVPKRSCQYRLA